jgi:hypothetical protein
MDTPVAVSKNSTNLTNVSRALLGSRKNFLQNTASEHTSAYHESNRAKKLRNPTPDIRLALGFSA